jgi:hypothetical protein
MKFCFGEGDRDVTGDFFKFNKKSAQIKINLKLKFASFRKNSCQLRRSVILMKGFNDFL